MVQELSWLAKINGTFVLVTKTVHQTFTHWSFWEILFYVDTLIIYNLHLIKFQCQISPTEEFLKLRVIPFPLGCRISEITNIWIQALWNFRDKQLVYFIVIVISHNVWSDNLFHDIVFLLLFYITEIWDTCILVFFPKYLATLTLEEKTTRYNIDTDSIEVVGHKWKKKKYCQGRGKYL